MTLAQDVTALVTVWIDADRQAHTGGLHALLLVHLVPVRMSDADRPSVKAPPAADNDPRDRPIATLLDDIRAGARRHEATLVHLALGAPTRYRPGGDKHTVYALTHLPSLVELAAQSPRDDVRNAATAAADDVRDWKRQAELLLGAERRWAYIRWTDPATGKPVVGRCPYCQTPVRIRPDLADDGDPDRQLAHMRAAPASEPEAEAVCPNPACHDDAGRRHTWPVNHRLGQLLLHGHQEAS